VGYYPSQRRISPLRRAFAPGLALAGLLAAVLVISLAPEVRASQHLRLVFKDQAMVTGPQIKMKDIVSTISGASEELKDQIMELVVDESPAPGRSKVLHPTVLNGLLTYNRLHLERVQAEIPPRVVVVRASQRVSQDELTDGFRQTVMDNLPWSCDKVVIEEVRAPQELILPAGRLELDFTLPRLTDMPGRVVIRLRVLVDGELVEQLNLSGLVKFYQRVVVSARPLNRHTILTRADLRLVDRHVRGEAQQFVYDPEELVGLRLTRRLRAGQPLRQDLVERPPLVHRGDRVTLVAEKGRLLITAAGLVQDQKAAKGETVKVLNLATRREVIGWVVNPQTVKVIF